MNTRSFQTYIAAGLLSATIVAGATFAGLVSDAAAQLRDPNIFAALTTHIQRQADHDKQAFAAASRCINWFYKQQHRKPAPPSVQRIAWSRSVQTEDAEAADCRSRYPDGLEAVRTDFQRTQALLSMTLTFYEFVLVGDGDDNARYNQRELRDILAALDLSTDASLGADGHLRALTGKFDALHAARGMESLMGGMSKLYEQGYRVTAADRARLNRMME